MTVVKDFLDTDELVCYIGGSLSYPCQYRIKTSANVFKQNKKRTVGKNLRNKKRKKKSNTLEISLSFKMIVKIRIIKLFAWY